MKYLSMYTDALGAREAVDADIYNKDEAKRAMDVNGPASFIPTNNARVNAFIAALGVDVKTDSPNANSDSPHTDSVTKDVHMYYPSAFVDADMYTHTLLHEVSHWLGTKTGTLPAGYSIKDMNGMTPVYAVEEITAEITAEMLAHEFGVPAHPIRPAYLHNYVKSLDRAAAARKLSEQDQFFAAIIGIAPSEHDEAYTQEQWDIAEKQADERIAYAKRYIAES